MERYSVIKSGRRYWSKFSPELQDFIRDNYPGRTSNELIQMIHERFGPDAMTLTQLRSYVRNHRLCCGVSCKFQKGQEPVNKGKSWDDYLPKESQAKCRKTCFKDGHLPHNAEPVGTIAKSTDGYLKQKIANPNKWVFVHRATWEKYHGPLPPGAIVTFKDGNKENCNIENLTMISMAENARMNRSHLRSSDPALTETGVLVARIRTKAGEKKKRRKKGGG